MNQNTDVQRCGWCGTDQLYIDYQFFGTTICYAHLQAVGYINDHITSCHCHPANKK